jgi:hypothetical protein
MIVITLAQIIGLKTATRLVKYAIQKLEVRAVDLL